MKVTSPHPAASHHAPDGGAEGEAEEVEVLAGNSVLLVLGAQVGEVGQEAVHLVHVRHYSGEELVMGE